MNDTEITELKRKANEIRKSIIRMLVAAGSGHTAGPLDMSDIFAALFLRVLRHDPKNPSWEGRDRLVLSNGHICPVLYAAMAHAGYFPVEELLTLRKFGSRLQGHPHREFLPSLETSSGPLGSGLSQAVGMALADRMDRGAAKGGAAPDGEGFALAPAAPGSLGDRFFYCLTGDGELDAGQNWEAMLQAGKEKLANLIVIVDRNKIQIDGFTEDIMPLEPLAEKLRAFNFEVLELDGNDMKQVVETLEKAKTIAGKPKVLLARTVASKGVPPWEGQYEWHGKPPTKEEGEMALGILEKAVF